VLLSILVKPLAGRSWSTLELPIKKFKIFWF
jgi:hypothetical protein